MRQFWVEQSRVARILPHMAIWERWFLPYCCFVSMRTFSSSWWKWLVGPSAYLTVQTQSGPPHFRSHSVGENLVIHGPTSLEGSLEMGFSWAVMEYSSTLLQLHNPLSASSEISKVLRNQKLFLKFGTHSYGGSIWPEMTWGVYRGPYIDKL